MECSESQIGCTYTEAYNFDPEAYTDDGSCIFPCQGDFNADNNKDILDIMILVNYIVNDMELEEYQYYIANINSDEFVNILDIISIVNLIIG